MVATGFQRSLEVLQQTELKKKILSYLAASWCVSKWRLPGSLWLAEDHLRPYGAAHSLTVHSSGSTKHFGNMRWVSNPIEMNGSSSLTLGGVSWRQEDGKAARPITHTADSYANCRQVWIALEDSHLPVTCHTSHGWHVLYHSLPHAS